MTPLNIDHFFGTGHKLSISLLTMHNNWRGTIVNLGGGGGGGVVPSLHPPGHTIEYLGVYFISSHGLV